MVGHPLSVAPQTDHDGDQKHPLKWISLPIRDVSDNSNRLDASFFGFDSRLAREHLSLCRWGTVSLGANFIENAYYLGRFKRVYVEKKNGLPFLLPSQIRDVYPYATKFISTATPFDLETARARSGQVLMTRSGTVGEVAYVSKTLNTKLLSDDVIRISAKDYPGYLYAYFKSKIGRILISTNNYGSVVKHIEPEHLENVPIPNPPLILRQHIHKLIEQSFELRDESNDLLDEAQNLLAGALQMPSIEDFQMRAYRSDNRAGVLNYSIPASQVNNRLDGSYHVPVVRTIESHLRNVAKKVVRLDDHCITHSLFLPTRFKRVYVDEGNGIPFFGGKNILELNPSGKKFLSFAQHERKIKEELIIIEGMVLITCSGTIGRTVLVPKHWDGWAMTHDVIRQVPSSNDIAGYLYAWLASPYAQMLISRFAYGATVKHIELEHISKVSVPLLHDSNIQTEVNDKVLAANDKRTEAYHLELEALKVLNEKVINAR